MSDTITPLSISLFSEILALDHLARGRISKVLPKGMELSHFIVLNYLSHVEREKSPAQLAKVFNLTRGAITNTLSKLEWAGYVHIRPDWDDARRKQVVISSAGRKARDIALSQIAPVLMDTVGDDDDAGLRAALQALRQLRQRLS